LDEATSVAWRRAHGAKALEECLNNLLHRPTIRGPRLACIGELTFQRLTLPLETYEGNTDARKVAVAFSKGLHEPADLSLRLAEAGLDLGDIERCRHAALGGTREADA
jgi:hypothetical protein